MYQFLTESECSDLVNLTFKKLGCPELMGEVAVKFSNRMTSTMGYAYRKKEKGIKLSKPLFDKATVEQRVQTIVHEACHIVQFVKFPKSKAHGPEWKSLMRAMKLEPKRCHNVDTTEFKVKKGGAVVKCPCRTHTFGATRMKRLRAGVKYHCRKCKNYIKEG